jgi:3-deoxy-D-manno-octulosonic acid kinase
MLADPGSLGNLFAVGDALFAPEFWAANGEIVPANSGRGSAWFIHSGPSHWVLRHYRRGGYAARLSSDRYLYLGESRVRAFAEFRLLATLVRRGLPVPIPVAARYVRAGLTYRCDLIMQRLSDARPVSNWLASTALCEEAWRAVGATIARLHHAGVDHADLNAHNILIDERGAVSVIDFDRGRLHARGGGAWAARNLDRLRRSLEKIARPPAQDRFSSRAWESLLAGYSSAHPSPSPIRSAQTGS